MTAMIRRPDLPTETQREAIFDALIAYSDPLAGPGPWPERRLCRQVEGGGGLYAKSYYDWIYVDLLFVPESARGGRLGAALLAAAEDQALAWGCHSIWLETFSFQARGFYEKQGYT